MTKDLLISLKGHSPNQWKSFASGTRATAPVTENVAIEAWGREGSIEANNDFAMSIVAVHKTDLLKCMPSN